MLGKILIMGLPGSGKTWLAERMMKYLDNCAWFNADVIRGAANDWDFSHEGRVRQANRMRTFADFEVSHGRSVICDFIAPTDAARDQFDADFVIWLDTIEAGRFEDTNQMFDPPRTYNVRVGDFLSDEQIEAFTRQLIEENTSKAA
jgi:adenylylsulfate kinase